MEEEGEIWELDNGFTFHASKYFPYILMGITNFVVQTMKPILSLKNFLAT